jgi:hypothetical protein
MGADGFKAPLMATLTEKNQGEEKKKTDGIQAP